MPRAKRKFAAGLVYHVLNRANGRLQIFRKPADFEALERVITEGLRRVPMRLCGYCIMPNHWHLLLWPRGDEDTVQFMHWITLTHTQRWHAAHGTAGIGHLYQGRFRSFPVQSDAHCLTVLRYIESNPLRAKLVANSRDWEHSSLAIRNGLDKQGLKIATGPVQLPTHGTDSSTSSPPRQSTPQSPAASNEAHPTAATRGLPPPPNTSASNPPSNPEAAPN